MTPVITTVQGKLMQLPQRQIYRYMGMGTTAADAELLAIVDQLIPQFLGKAQCKACYMVVPVSVTGNDVDLSVLRVTSGHLARNLHGCSKAILFAATLGMGIEQMKRTASVKSPVNALVLDAMGSAGIEVFCNQLCEVLGMQYPSYKARPRFSPGYGDLPLSVQKQMLLVLDATRKIGITLTDGMLMIPQKSVTAIMGLGRDGCVSSAIDCEECGKTDCEFRL